MVATTLTAYVKQEHKDLLKLWAAEEDRSVSSFVQRLIEAEQKRRRTSKQQITAGSDCQAAA
jgi:hypothetical protein